jgi:hypothetical protein
MAGSAAVPVPAGEELRVQEVRGAEAALRGHEPPPAPDIPDHCSGSLIFLLGLQKDAQIHPGYVILGDNVTHNWQVLYEPASSYANKRCAFFNSGPLAMSWTSWLAWPI